MKKKSFYGEYCIYSCIKFSKGFKQKKIVGDSISNMSNIIWKCIQYVIFKFTLNTLNNLFNYSNHILFE